MDRRRWLQTAIAALGGSIAAGLGGLGGLFAGATSRWPVRTAKEWAALCTLRELEAGEPLARSFSFVRLEGWYLETVTRQVYVTRDPGGAPVVFSRRCTHLGCQVTWKPPSRNYKCPCHGGAFDGGGNVVDGPPPRSLVVLPSRVAGEVVEVEKA